MRESGRGAIHITLVAALAALLPAAWPWSSKPSKSQAPAASLPAEQEPTMSQPDTDAGKAVNRSFGRVNWQKQQQLTAPLKSKGVLTAGTKNGSIAVTGREDDGCDVSVTITATATSEKRAAELAGQVKVALVPKDGQVRVDVQEPRTSGLESVRVDLKIQVPRLTGTDLHNDNGQIGVNDVEGNILCRTDNGRIDLRSVAGRVDLGSDNGRITAADLAADAQIQTDNGAIEIRYADGRPRTCSIRSDNGRITCRNLSGDLKAEAGNGSIDAAYAVDAPGVCRIDITSDNGKIHLVTPRSLSAKVVARSDNGRISTNLPLTVNGKRGKRIDGEIGSGQGQVQLRSSNGSIELD